MAQPQLEYSDANAGRYDEDIPKLYQRIHRLEQELKQERGDREQAIKDARNQSAAALRSQAKLKQWLQPFYDLVRQIFEELEDVDPSHHAVSPASANQPPSEAAYRAWKQQLPPSCGKIIDALLVQPLTNAQLKTICHLGSTSVSEGIRILANNKVVEKDGSLNRLRRL